MLNLWTDFCYIWHGTSPSRPNPKNYGGGLNFLTIYIRHRLGHTHTFFCYTKLSFLQTQSGCRKPKSFCITTSDNKYSCARFEIVINRIFF